MNRKDLPQKTTLPIMFHEIAENLQHVSLLKEHNENELLHLPELFERMKQTIPNNVTDNILNIKLLSYWSLFTCSILKPVNVRASTVGSKSIQAP